MAHEKIHAGEHIKHDTDLEPSYGQHIPQPSMKKGDYVAFGELAGTRSSAMGLDPERITFGDSIKDQERNLPKSSSH